ncbi:MAG: response regulator [Myxococcaceae bacterium]|nr:response regulator [Myxococcaceae bacterium]
MPVLVQAAEGTTRSRRGRVLVVDDQRVVADSVARLLEYHHDVETASGAAEALRRIHEGRQYDAIVSDLMMPGMSGIDLYDALARLSPELAERMVFMTGGAFTKAARDFLDGVSNPTLDKPFDANRLYAAVNSRVGL